MIDGRQFMRQYLQLTYNHSSSLHLAFFRTNRDFPTSLMSVLPSESDEESAEQLINLKGAPAGITEVFGDEFDPQVTTRYSHSVSGPINGIYCISGIQFLYQLYDFIEQLGIVKFAFWNPDTGQFHVLPPIPLPAMLDVFIDLQRDPVDHHADIRSLHVFYWGFVLDPVSQDYTFFCISEYGNGLGPCNLVCFHLYSLASNSWQELHHSHITFPPGVIEFHNNGGSSFIPLSGMDRVSEAFPFNGSCHWVYYRVDDDGLLPNALSFDIVEHAFRLSAIPPTLLLAEARRRYVKSLTVDGCLAVASPSNADDSSLIGIIVMKEYGVDESWFRAYNIVHNSPSRFTGFVKDQLFVQEKDSGRVVSYRLGANQDEYNEYCRVPSGDIEILPFDGSLVPIHPGHSNSMIKDGSFSSHLILPTSVPTDLLGDCGQHITCARDFQPCALHQQLLVCRGGCERVRVWDLPAGQDPRDQRVRHQRLSEVRPDSPLMIGLLVQEHQVT